MKALFPLLLLVFVANCGADDEKFQFVATKEADGVLSWQRAEIALEQKTPSTNKKSMVMVSYPVTSRMGQFIHDSETEILASHTDDDALMTHLLVATNSTFTLDHLARLAHSHEGFACGNIELIHPRLAFNAVAASTETRYPPIYPESVPFAAVSALTNQVSTDQLKSHMQTLAALGTRHHSTNPGATDTVKALMNAAGFGATLSVTETTHSESPQKSLVAALVGTKTDDEIVILGGHLDSINPSDNTIAPGVDDNASGIATILEAMRILAASGAKFDRRVEFHAYAAEEALLVGSQDLAATYKKAGKKVAAMLQLDMNSYSSEANDETIYLVDTDTSANLRRSLKDLLHTYLGGDFVTAPLRSGTSDHKAWHNQGYAVVFPFQNPVAYNPFIHSASDTLSNAGNLALAKRFTKLVLAYLSHNAGLTSMASESGLVSSTIGAFKKDTPMAVVNINGSYRAFLSLPTSVTSAALCSVSAKDAAGCQLERIELTLVGEKSGRNVFATPDTMNVSDGSRFRIFGYNASDKLVDQRTVLLSKK